MALVSHVSLGPYWATREFSTGSTRSVKCHHFGPYNTGSQVDSGGDQLPFGLRLPALSSLDRVLDAAGT